MQLNDKVYNVLKIVLGTCVAPVITLIVTLGELYGFDTSIVVGTISAIATCLGAIFGISVYNYSKTSDADTSVEG